MRLFLQILAIGIVLAAGGFGEADAPSTQPSTRASMAVINHLQSQLRGIATVESDFVEEKNLAMLNHTLKIEGHIALEKPDRLIWIVDKPVRYAVRIVGDEVRQWDEDTNRVDVIHLGGDPAFKAISQQIQAWFLGNYKELGDSYDVYLDRDQPLSLTFVPRGDSMVTKLLSGVDLTFNTEETYIDTMVVREAGGDTTTIRFVNSRVNQPIKRETWEMPPNER